MPLLVVDFGTCVALQGVLADHVVDIIKIGQVVPDACRVAVVDCTSMRVYYHKCFVRPRLEPPKQVGYEADPKADDVPAHLPVVDGVEDRPDKRQDVPLIYIS